MPDYFQCLAELDLLKAHVGQRPLDRAVLHRLKGCPVHMKDAVKELLVQHYESEVGKREISQAPMFIRSKTVKEVADLLVEEL
ncbi:MAG: hypothetical protein C4521_10850 [Actinobacteria bacterium]|nr:MAG: hypothetical protein C4521_10850 [Actinomycetota bacterium]